MSEHYFSQKPHSKSSPKKWNYQLRDRVYTFESDYGVFSKDEVDFGTRLLIEQFTPPAMEGDFLDLGCGYGPIGISLADCFPDRSVVMVDVNERAISLAERNAAHNETGNVRIIQSDGFRNIADKSFAAILTNPPIRAGKKTVHQMLEDSKNALLDGGELWVVIQKKQGAPSAMEKLKSLFGEMEIISRNKGYYILRATNV